MRATGVTPEVSSLYVHVPFCARQCGYCDFAISVGRQPDGVAWGEAIGAEWQTALKSPEWHIAGQLETVYVGGGTPSLLGADVMTTLRGVLGDARLGGPGLEWTGEANPESIDPAVARAWRRAGVTRVSLGIQSYHEPTLRWMGRLHGPEGAEQALAQLLGAGFDSVTADLIFGLPTALGRDWRDDLTRLAGSGVPHISLYGLTVEPGTPLARAVTEGRTAAVDEVQYEEEYLEASERLVEAGYEHYEVSSFARPGHRSVHNQKYWNGSPYLGLGNGAHSYLPPRRSWNVREWPDYLERIRSGTSAVAETEEVVGEKARLEELWLGLRRTEGLSVGSVDEAHVARWCRNGQARVVDGRVSLTAQGWLLLDQLVVDASTAPPPDEASDGHQFP